jgi:hypothetical protein
MAKAQTEAQRARPPKPTRRRGNLTIRIQDAVRAELQREADEHQCSLSEEVENRLGRSLLNQQIMVEALELAYGREAAAILIILGSVMTDAGRTAGLISRGLLAEMEWLSDPYAYSQATQAVNTILAAIKPPGNPDILRNSKMDDPLAEEFTKLGTRRANITLSAIKDREWGKQFPEQHRNLYLERFAEQMREMLGPLVSRIPGEGEPAQ